jgi:light-regulated signal transduction histidine kinase (bacteriophytochrome)
MLNQTLSPIHNTTPLGAQEKSAEVTLERLREDMDILSYITSHDLQAPLRAILDGYDVLRQHPSLAGDQEAWAAMQKMGDEAARLKILLQGMLDYIRLETFAPAHAQLEGNELIEAALAALKDDIQKAGATLTYDSLPQVMGHRGRLTRLFAHLIDNALKFRSTQPPIIHISVSRAQDEWTFCVADNGIGIDEEHHDIIFSLFQRLHTADAYPGHGIGLSLSKKIVATHGGELWVESAPKTGSRFYFTLPAIQ